jgi:hypothetical protein
VKHAYFWGSSQSYINQFHFISIPAGLQTRLFTKNNFSADVNAGIDLMQLITTNALIYDTTLKLYYNKKSVFTAMQLSLYAGFQVNYELKNKLMLSAGPQFTQGFTPVGGSYNYSNKYFRMWALQVKYQLNKKMK